MRRFFLMLLFILSLGYINAEAIDISAECACLMIKETGEIIYEKNSELKHNIASTTKIMTGLIALENSEMTDIVSVSENAANQEGSSIYIEKGNKVLMGDLVYGMMLNSGNDAAVAISEHISDSVDVFAKLMTERANEMGAVNTSFKNPSGLDEDGHYSTAKDMALITKKALENEEFSKIVSTRNHKISIDGNDTYLKNHNKLLWNYDGCIGVKTGYTKKTGRCLVSAVEKDGITLICVTLNAPDDWNDHKKLFDYGFSKIVTKKIINKNDIIKEFNIDGNKFFAISAEDIELIGTSESLEDIKIEYHIIKEPRFSIMKNEKIGYAEYLINGNREGYFKIVSDRDFVIQERKINFLELFINYISKIVK